MWTQTFLGRVTLAINVINVLIGIFWGIYKGSIVKLCAIFNPCFIFDADNFDAVFFRTDPLLYHKFENMVIFRSGNLYSLCSPGNQDYQIIIHF